MLNIFWYYFFGTEDLPILIGIYTFCWNYLIKVFFCFHWSEFTFCWKFGKLTFADSDCEILGAIFYTPECIFGGGVAPSCQTIGSLLRTPLAGEAGQNNDQTIAWITNFCLLVNIFFGGGGRGRGGRGRGGRQIRQTHFETKSIHQMFLIKSILFKEKSVRKLTFQLQNLINSLFAFFVSDWARRR